MVEARDRLVDDIMTLLDSSLDAEDRVTLRAGFEATPSLDLLAIYSLMNSAYKHGKESVVPDNGCASERD